MGLIAERYRSVRRNVADAADCVGRAAEDVRIVAVTKTVGVPEIRDAITVGMVDFGENRVQDFLAKYGLFPDVRWHFIGTLQSNKVKDVVGRAYLIHSVDSLRLLEKIASRADDAGVVQQVLLQVNVSGEESKHGFVPGDVEDALISASSMGNVEVRGLMTMAPFGRAEDARNVFRGLRELRETLGAIRANGVELEELSMGMSGDYRVAVEEGATIVRIGRSIFGK